MECKKGDYWITTETARMDIRAIHAYLSRSYWAKGIPIETVAQAVERSLCFGLFCGSAQVGMARVITDRATFAYLCDVYVLEEHRGKDLSKRLMEQVMAHPDLQGLRRWMLVTRDAHDLYRRYGFETSKQPERVMEIVPPDPYRR